MLTPLLRDESGMYKMVCFSNEVELDGKKYFVTFARRENYEGLELIDSEVEWFNIGG